MKNLLNLFLLSAAALLVSACQDINNLKEMPHTTKAMQKTTEEMSADMKEMKQTTKDMKTTTEGMAQNMEKMTAAVHDQQIELPFTKLLEPENSEVLSPIPERMMPYGKKMAEAATAMELIETTYLWLKAIDETYPEKANPETPYTKAEVAAINHQKAARYSALNVLAGFTPEKTVQEIIDLQIIKGGRYRNTAYQFLMLRTQFIRDVLLDQSLLALPLSEIGQVEEAIKYMSQLDFIAKLPFAGRIAIKTKGFLAPVDNVVENLDRKEIAQKWASIAQKTELDCKISTQAYSTDSKQNESIFADESARYTKATATIQDYLSSWKATLN